jgi:very-short-patch-repair endonuclease
MNRLARMLRRKQTEAERRLWRHLRNRRLGSHKFRRQYSVGPYIVDFVCLEQRLVVEIDGGQHMQQQKRDERRTEFLESHGYSVLRFWNHEVTGNFEAVLEQILRTLTAPSSPALLPEGEGCPGVRDKGQQ